MRAHPARTHDGRPYRRGEVIADGWIHALGVTAGIAGAAALLGLAMSQGDARLIAVTALYALGLVAMLLFSALYNMVRPSAWKERLRRLDRAAIFAMIAGTYTPFLLGRMGGGWGFGLFAFVALGAALGATAAFAFPYRFERLQLAGCLLLGWSILVALQPLFAAVPWPAVLLLVAGGVLYSLGVVFHLWQRLGYHNAIWHGFVLTAAGCHYAAVLLGVVLPGVLL